MPADLKDLPAGLKAKFFEFLTMYDKNLKQSKNPPKIHVWLRPFWEIFGPITISKILVDLKDMPHAS